MTVFATHMQALTQEFIGTVLFVDDQIPEKAIVNVVYEAKNELNEALLELEQLQVPGDQPLDLNHILDIRKLSQACSDRGMLCSPVYTSQISSEEEKNKLVDKVVMLSNKADVIVLDWQMEDLSGPIGMGITAQSIVQKLKSINKDREVLICIFSAESADKIDIAALSGGHVTVFYVSKTTERAYEELPVHIYEKFSDMHSGLMPAAALSAIKVIRDNSHRILSLYSTWHDPAFLSHRCYLSRPEDADIFVTELIAATFDDLIRGNEAITKYFSSDVLKAWVDLRCNDLPDKEFNVNKLDPIQVDNDKRKQWIETGITKWMHDNLNAGAEPKKADVINKWGKVTATSLVGYFSNEPTPESEFAKQTTFAKLTSHAFVDAINNNAATYLSLGSILKNVNDEYFMCIQPLCDSGRLKAGCVNKFIFIKLVKKEVRLVDDGNKKGFNIVVSDGENNDVYLKASEELSTLDVFWFSASLGNDKAIMKIGELVQGKQNETADVNFTFLAQLKSSQAQRIAMRFLNKITRIGLDESEWL